jgi:hypothetical protein
VPRIREVTREIIDQIRTQRREGARVSVIARYLTGLGLGFPEVVLYLEEAFCLTPPKPNVHLRSRGLEPPQLDQLLEDLYEPEIERSAPRWLRDEPYPDFLRRRDRRTFRDVARLTRTILIVRPAERSVAQYVSKPGYCPCPVHLRGVSRRTQPGDGLLSADPDDPRLTRFLAALTPAMSYSNYVRDLARLGFHVDAAETGYLIRDASNNAFYHGYCLQGVYSADKRCSAWTGREGERIRAALNLRLGADLVQWGPHDDAEPRLRRHRTGALGPLDGPHSLVLAVDPVGEIQVKWGARVLPGYYRHLGINWKSLYPDPPQEADH